MKPFFTESDFADDGGYWKSRSYCIEHANKKVAALVAVVEKVLRQDEQRGYPTTSEWHSIAVDARSLLSEPKA